MSLEQLVHVFAQSINIDDNSGIIFLVSIYCLFSLLVIRITGTAKAPPSVEKLEEAETLPQSPNAEIRESFLSEEIQELPRPIQPKLKVEVQPLDQRLSKTKKGFFDRIRTVFSSGQKLNEEMLEELQYALIGSDVGVKTVKKTIDELGSSLKRGEEVGEDELILKLKQQLNNILGDDEIPTLEQLKPNAETPYILLVVGVNGVGKTTTTAKLASKCVDKGLTVLLVAADTFRAAAVEQISLWGERIGVPVVKGAPEAKPQSVVFDAMVRAKNENYDVVIIDTAGRLHTKTSLMQELEGLKNAIQRHYPAGPSDVFLVVDGSTGQNALNQAKEFNEAVSLTGLIVTKLDGSPKGGIVVAIKDELNIPVRYIGVGEGPEDLRTFHAHEFVDAILSREGTDVFTAAPDAISAHAKTRRRRRGAEGNAAVETD